MSPTTHFKACVYYFLSNVYFSPNDSPSKTIKNVFYFMYIKTSFRSWDIQIFIFSSSLFFFPVSHCFRGWFKRNLKVYDVINCLNKNWMTHFVSYLEKEIRCDIETLPIDSVKYRTFLRKNHAENVHQNLVPDPFLILLNNPKWSLHAKSSFSDKVFWKRIIKKPLKS